MKMHVDFESVFDIAEFVRAWAPVFMTGGAMAPVAPAQEAADVTPPAQKKKKPPKQKAAEPEEAADQAEADTTDPNAADTEEADTADEDKAVDEKVYSLEEVREALAVLNKAGKRAEVKELLASFGAGKLSEIPKEQYGEVMAKAGEL